MTDTLFETAVESVEWRLRVIWRTGSDTFYSKRDEAHATADAQRYESDPLDRIAVVESRTVTATPWREHGG